jgi:voltage-gated sodium channel
MTATTLSNGLPSNAKESPADGTNYEQMPAGNGAGAEHSDGGLVAFTDFALSAVSAVSGSGRRNSRRRSSAEIVESITSTVISPERLGRMTQAQKESLEATLERARKIQELEESEKLKKELRLQFSTSSAKVVLQPDEKLPGLRGHVHDVIGSSRFDMAIGLVIVANSATIGLESSFELSKQDTRVFGRLEHVFLFIYSVELFLRFYTYGMKCFRSGWVCFDFILVTIGLVANYVVPIIEAYYQGSDESGAVGFLLVLRTFRLARLARTIRLLAQFKVLWMLVRGLLASAGTMTYVFILFALILYVFACMGVEIITKPQLALSADEREMNLEYDRLVTNHWGSISLSVYTLMMFATVDSAGAIYIPMSQHRPVLIVYFVAFLLLVSICLMNLVTAVIVESSFDQAAQDKEVAKAHKAKIIEGMMPRLKQMFEELDSDNDKEISLKEFGAMDDRTREELCELFNTDDLVELFEVLDVDGGGSVSIEEFCDEMTKLATTHMPMDQIRVLKQISIIRGNVVDNQTCMSEMMEMMTNQSIDTDSHRSELDKRISTVESKLEFLSVSVADVNRSLAVLLEAAGKTPPEPKRFDI